ncbi:MULTISPECIES: tRNA pseudouridine(55) synthase TruB [unclassified Granulicatella]|uniref:tRNA pseudouridine(55) synthase TruB n=1 Tax=unclassified Granulicatella TaxID=2630493 RepID=UPI00107411C0|nr:MULTISPECIES: tRNA pseudouridine(55) synthase TruB [unclassified Granulicatella]MBF0779726.1 tRNA pseudouridine(55) synthase TruB [Granulicatella sp. 19428wC4_WM01]TFU96246.1 tRNA pseudouridine(55) synthase TruB [Granulicatella sp. WM01]
MNGVLALWKERGMTSHDCVYKLRKLFQTKKIGHTGTLDPNVDGVLPICVGSATKMVEFMLNSAKQYTGEITLGIATSTEDSTGEIIEQSAVVEIPTAKQIDSIMQKMTGEIMQVPPMYSAVKVNGKKLYEYARANQTVERPSRKVSIYEFKRISDVVVHDNQTVSWKFCVTCSKGTYIRTLAVDLGKLLGYPAHMSDLTRLKSAGISQQQCVKISDLEKLSLEERYRHLLPIEEVFLEYETYEIDDVLWKRVRNGAVVEVIEGISYPIFFTYQQKIVAFYDKHTKYSNMIKPKKMLLENKGDL